MAHVLKNTSSLSLILCRAIVEEFLKKEPVINDEVVLDDFLSLFYLLELISKRRKDLFSSENASIVYCFLKYICENVSTK